MKRMTRIIKTKNNQKFQKKIFCSLHPTSSAKGQIMGGKSKLTSFTATFLIKKNYLAANKGDRCLPFLFSHFLPFVLCTRILVGTRTSGR